MSDEPSDVRESPTVAAERAARRAEIAAALAEQPVADTPAFQPEDATPAGVANDRFANDRRVHISAWGRTDERPGWKNYECALCLTPLGNRQFAWLDPQAMVAHLAEFHRDEPAE